MIIALILAAFPNPNTGNSSFPPAGSVGTAQLQDGAVTEPKLSGALQKTIDAQPFVVTNYGSCQATTDGSVDCLAGFNAAIVAMGAASAHPVSADLIVPTPTTAGAYYYLSGPLHITRTLHLYGAGGTGSNQFDSRAKIVWTTGSNGIVIDYADGATKDGIGAEIDHLSLVGQSYSTEWSPTISKGTGAIVIPRNRTGYIYVNNGSPGTTGSTEPTWNTTISGNTTDGGVTWTTAVASAVQMLGYASVHDNSISGWSGNGIHIEANSPGSNANQWRVYQNFIQSNAGSGIYVTGSDVNAGHAEGNIVDSNDAWGINELSGLGNTYTANEISSNGVLFVASGTTGTGLWVHNRLYSANSRVLPTTKNGYYFRTTSGGTSSGSEPTWPTTIGNTVVDGTVTWTCFAKYSGGSVNFGTLGGSDASVANGNYAESGQYPIVLGNYSSWRGGTNGSSYDSTSTGRLDFGAFSSGFKVLSIGAFATSPITDGAGLSLGASSSYPLIFDTAISSGSTNQYVLTFGSAAGLASAWQFQNQASATFNPMTLTTATTTLPGHSSASADQGVVGLRNGLYFGTAAQRIYSTTDSPGAKGYFGDLSIRDYQNAAISDGVLAYVNLKFGGGQDWAPAIQVFTKPSDKTSTYTTLSSDSGQWFSNFGTSSEVTFNLAAYGDDGAANYGWHACFAVEDSDGLKLVANDRSDVIYLGSVATATNGYIESTIVGSTACVLFTRFSNSPTNTIGTYLVTSSTGSWSVH